MYYCIKFLIPVNIICAASAERISPVILLMMVNPFFFRTCSRYDARYSINPTKKTDVKSAKRPITFSLNVSISTPMISIAPIVAGPTITGMERGTTAISSSKL